MNVDSALNLGFKDGLDSAETLSGKTDIEYLEGYRRGQKWAAGWKAGWAEQGKGEKRTYDMSLDDSWWGGYCEGWDSHIDWLGDSAPALPPEILEDE